MSNKKYKLPNRCEQELRNVSKKDIMTFKISKYLIVMFFILCYIIFLLYFYLTRIFRFNYSSERPVQPEQELEK